MPADQKSKSESKNDSFFSLAQSTSSFSSRCNDAFASLDALEKKHEAYEHSRAHSKTAEKDLLMKADPSEESDFRPAHGKRSNDGRPYHRNYRDRGQTRSDYYSSREMGHHRRFTDRRDDGFRRPSGRPPRQAYSVPDYKKNPDKWTCYSLEDVDNTDMSERSNREAAFEFLAERKKAREAEREANKDEEQLHIGEAACSKGLIAFSKPKKSSSDSSVKRDSSLRVSASEKLYADSDPEQFSAEEQLLLGVGEEVDVSSPADHIQSSSSDILTETGTTGFNFKARKSVRRNIRHKESDDCD